MADVLPPRTTALGRVNTEVVYGGSNNATTTRKPAQDARSGTTSSTSIQPSAEGLFVRGPNTGSTVSFPSKAMAPPSYGPNPNEGTEDSIDPISRQILERTQTQNRVSQAFPGGAPSPSPSAVSDTSSIRQSSVSAPLRRADTGASSKQGKEKKKGVSFLSRMLGNKKREESDEFVDNVSEIAENRLSGMDAEVFSYQTGYIPKFPAPPKYIKVKAQNRKRKDFDRVFLSQILLEERKVKSRKAEKVDYDEKIISIDEATPTPANVSPAKGAGRAIWAAEFSKDGKYFATAGQDKILRVWEVISTLEDRENGDKPPGSETGSDAGSKEETKLNAPVFKQKMLREYDGHTSSILDLSWSKNNFLLSSSMDKTVRLYHVSRAECLCAFKHNDFVTSIQFHPRDDRFFLAGSLDAKLRLWSIPDKNVAYVAQLPDMITAVAFTPDGKTSIAGCTNGMCILFDTEGLKAHSQIHVRSARGRNSKGSKISGIDTIAVPREQGQTDVKLLITSNDSRVRMYNLKDRNLEIKFRGNENNCSQIHATFSNDGKYVICGSEDRKVYIWPTGPTEKPESDKRPVEVFEASSAIVTSALFAPTNTRRLLAQSGDPIYDLCNPPPVVLLSRADSMMSSRAPTEHSGEKSGEKVDASVRNTESPSRAPESPAYLNRHSHYGGQLIATADHNGQIKIFRQDCAFQKRRAESWDGRSAISKTLGRSGSIKTRTTDSSSAIRNSVNLHKSPSADRIINWRDSVSNNQQQPSNSLSSVAVNDSPESRRSSSPRKSIPFTKRFSLRPRESSTPGQWPSNLKTTTPLTPPATAKSEHLGSQPTISVESPHSPTQNFHTPHSSVSAAPGEHDAPTASPQTHPITNATPSQPNPMGRNPNDPLWLGEGQSFMHWDMQHTLLPMAQHAPRTPAFLGDELNIDPLRRRNSAVSQLSSELVSSSSVTDDGDDAQTDGKCRKCGNDSFRVSKEEDGGRRVVRCRKCGEAV